MENVRNYNIHSEAGMDDMETCEDLGLDPSLAYKTELCDAALDKMQARNIEAIGLVQMEEGIPADEAHKNAIEESEKLRKVAQDNLDIVRKRRGYV
jgi:hypothetical protein